MEKLTEKEALVMKVLWDWNKPIKPSELLEVLNKTYDLGWKISTIATYLNRLSIKKYVTKDKHEYVPMIDEEVYITNVANNFVEVWGQASSRTLIDALICTLN